jgi:hypothetical protein
MIDRLAALIVHEANWLPVSMGLALLAVILMLSRRRQSDLPRRRLIIAAMNLFFGVTIGTMVCGHFLAVTTRFALGTLGGSVLRLYAIGIALAVPSWWLIHHATGLFSSNGDRSRRTVVLNVWLGATLLALGLPNIPLAVPAFLNIGYQLHARRVVGWAIVSLAVVLNVGLFIGGLIFMASGQTFEQFSGMQ